MNNYFLDFLFFSFFANNTSLHPNICFQRASIFLQKYFFRSFLLFSTKLPRSSLFLRSESRKVTLSWYINLPKFLLQVVDQFSCTQVISDNEPIIIPGKNTDSYALLNHSNKSFPYYSTSGRRENNAYSREHYLFIYWSNKRWYFPRSSMIAGEI